MIRSTENVKVVDQTANHWAGEKVSCPFCHTAVYDGEKGFFEPCPHLILAASSMDSDNITIYDKAIKMAADTEDAECVEDKVRKAMQMMTSPAELHVFDEDDYLGYYLFRE